MFAQQIGLGTTAELTIAAQSPFAPWPPEEKVENPVVIGAPKPVPKSVLCSCVLYLRTALGVDVHGDAWTIPSNTPKKYARVGDVVLLDYNIGHAAVITAVTEPAENKIYLTIAESNFHSCKPDTRVIALADEHIRGIYRPA